MKPKILKIDPSNIDTRKIKIAADIVNSGGLVAFPTETVYGIACRATAKSLARLSKLKQRTPQKYYTLHIGLKTDVNKYVPTIDLRTGKLIKNAWPGPLTIVFQLRTDEIQHQKHKIGDEAFTNLYKDNSIGIRCPSNPIASMLLQLINNPTVAPSANLTDDKPPTQAHDVLTTLKDQIELLIDGGTCKYQKNSTVARIGEGDLQILRSGVYSKADLETMSQVRLLFVCTGNTCRSPMAAAIFCKYLSEKLRCKIDNLQEKGYKVISAGTMGLVGLSASKEAMAACAAKGINIETHESQALSKKLIEESDLVFAMAKMHQERIIALCPAAADKCIMLAGNVDIADPIGQPQAFYDQCADVIEKAVKQRFCEFIV